MEASGGTGCGIERRNRAVESTAESNRATESSDGIDSGRERELTVEASCGVEQWATESDDGIGRWNELWNRLCNRTVEASDGVNGGS